MAQAVWVEPMSSTRQAERGDTLLVARHVPGRGEPDRERGPRPMKNCPRCRRDTPGTAAARPTTVTKPPTNHCTAMRAGEAVRPPQPRMSKIIFY